MSVLRTKLSKQLTFDFKTFDILDKSVKMKGKYNCLMSSTEWKRGSGIWL